jgi:hypothetical protein
LAGGTTTTVRPRLAPARPPPVRRAPGAAAVERQLPDHHGARQPRRRHAALGGEDGQGDRQVVGRARLAQVARGQVDGEPRRWQRVPDMLQGRPHALLGLHDGGVAEAHQVSPGSPPATKASTVTATGSRPTRAQAVVVACMAQHARPRVDVARRRGQEPVGSRPWAVRLFMEAALTVPYHPRAGAAQIERGQGPAVAGISQEVRMMKSLRSMALVVVGAFALSACGLGALIPDQEVSGGVLGLGSGVDVVLTGGGVAVTAVEASAVTTWVGTLQKHLHDRRERDRRPEPGQPRGPSPNGSSSATRRRAQPDRDTGAFTLTGFVIGGTVTVGLSFNVPASAGVAGLDVSFGEPTCVADGDERVCTYTTAESVPSVDLAFLPNQVQAYWNLLRSSGGTVAVDLTVTVALASPGLPMGATVTVTLVSGGATIEF